MESAHGKQAGEDVAVPRPAGGRRTKNQDQIVVDEAGRESFPASDPPVWTPTHTGSRSTPPGAVVAKPLRTETPSDMRRRLRADVEVLALRSRQAVSDAARRQVIADFVSEALLDAGRTVERVPLPGLPQIENIEAVIRGANEGDELVIGAPYELTGRHGAHGGLDHLSGVAVFLGLARLLTGRRFPHTVRLVAFGDTPLSWTAARLPTPRTSAGSVAHIRRLRDHHVLLQGMITIGSVGFFAERAERSSLPLPLRLLPTRVLAPVHGDFVAFVGDRRSRPFTNTARDAFALATHLEARTYSVPALVRPRRWLPHVRVTDTLLPTLHRHRPERLPECVSYERMADLVFGLASIVSRLASRAT